MPYKEPFTNCPICDKKVRKTGLKIHAEIHGEYRIRESCEICGKRIAGGKSNLKQHMYKMHDESRKKYSCEECGKKFLTENSLNIHTPTHRNKISCEICGRDFFGKGQLSKLIFCFIFKCHCFTEPLQFCYRLIKPIVSKSKGNEEKNSLVHTLIDYSIRLISPAS